VDIGKAVLGILDEVLQLGARAAELNANSPLLGAIPELDSMAVAGLLTEIEDRMEISIEDDEVEFDMLETYGALLDFVTAKRAGA
jgi:acyl carrier protein